MTGSTILIDQLYGDKQAPPTKRLRSLGIIIPQALGEAYWSIQEQRQKHCGVGLAT